MLIWGSVVSGARKLLLSGVAVTALLVFVAIGEPRPPRLAAAPAVGAHRRPRWSRTTLSTIALVVMPIGAILVIWGLR